jgi:hypothetical protein
MTYDETSRDNESSDRDTDSSSADQRSLKKLLRKAGWTEKRAFFEPENDGPGVFAEDDDGSPKARSNAERKADQRKRKLDAGFRQLNVEAPDDDDARALIAQVAKASQSKQARRDVRAVLADRDLVMIGRRVQRLRGQASAQVRALLKL